MQSLSFSCFEHSHFVVVVVVFCWLCRCLHMSQMHAPFDGCGCGNVNKAKVKDALAQRVCGCVAQSTEICVRNTMTAPFVGGVDCDSNCWWHCCRADRLDAENSPDAVGLGSWLLTVANIYIGSRAAPDTGKQQTTQKQTQDRQMRRHAVAAAPPSIAAAVTRQPGNVQRATCNNRNNKTKAATVATAAT